MECNTNSISFKSSFIPEYSVATNPINKLTPSPEQFSQDKVSDKGAYAAKLYALIAPKFNVSFEKKSIEEYKNELLGQGKFEGKDFAVKKYNFDTQLECPRKIRSRHFAPYHEFFSDKFYR